MQDTSNSLPSHLPGIQVDFALKQCLGKRELLLTLLDKFWADYKDTARRLSTASLESVMGQKLLHDLQGAATNLGLEELHETSHRLEARLKSDGELTEDERQQFHMELEKVGGSIKSLDSMIQS